MSKPFTPYNEARQSQPEPPEPYEDLLADGLEYAFGQGIHDLPGIVAELINRAVPSPGAQAWTEDLLRTELARLGQ